MFYTVLWVKKVLENGISLIIKNKLLLKAGIGNHVSLAVVFEEMIKCNYNSPFFLLQKKMEIHKFSWEGEQLLRWLNEKQNTRDFCRGKLNVF